MSTNKYLTKLKPEEELAVKSYILGPGLEFKFDELKQDVVRKIEKELEDSKNARDYITQKYEELCRKIQFLTELDATVIGFRSDVRAIEKQVTELASRVMDIEKRTICKDCPSIASDGAPLIGSSYLN